jgi:2-isopropylmalate synthase
VGFVGTGLVLGKHSGRHAFKVRLASLGVDLKEDQLDAAFERFKVLADKKKQVFDEDLIAIVEDEAAGMKRVWTLDDLTTVSGSSITPEVKIVLKSRGRKYTKVSTGDGPVDACYKAIDSIVKVKGKLLDYSIQSVTQGKDALGEVTIRVRLNDKTVVSRGTSTDIIVASAKAYIDAVNKILTQGDLYGPNDDKHVNV